MPKKMSPKGKIVKGCDYVEDDEKYDRKMQKKDVRGMKTAGLALKLKQSEKEEGYSNKPRVKPQKKVIKSVTGQRKGY